MAEGTPAVNFFVAHFDVHQMDWLVCWNGKNFDAARSSEAANESALATFAYRIMLNVRRL
jgi:hypothetical protein